MRDPSALLAGAAVLVACAYATETRAAVNEFTYAEPQPVKDARATTPQPVITRFADADRDGRVTRAEAEQADPALAQNFNRYDLDRNDALDRGEFARLEAESRQRQAAALLPSPMPSPGRAEPMSGPALAPALRSSPSLNRSGPARPGSPEAS